MSSKYSLKPLTGESETGFYRYNGTPIQQKDKEYYEALGVKFSIDADLMPDGVRLKPRRLRSDNRGRRKTVASTKMAREEAEAFRLEYDSLPEPKPSFMEWYASTKEAEITAMLVTIAKDCSERAGDRLKALATLLEFTKSKPKSQMEISAPEQPTKDLSAQEILELAYQLNGIEPPRVDPAMKKVH